MLWLVAVHMHAQEPTRLGAPVSLVSLIGPAVETHVDGKSSAEASTRLIAEL
ncbi:MAG: hypothetical protein HKP36_13820 [Myxococcales bacterium]|nr:hypothetical protein [Deltaproteobacteria bacterium]NNL25517.1 hypothetical protein [Myxococcales bacterium]